MSEMTTPQRQDEEDNDSEVRAQRRAHALKIVAFTLGVSQGCPLCFYVSCGSYFSDFFSDPLFFVKTCAFFYLPPILVTVAQLVLDARFDAIAGVRKAIVFRIVLSSTAVAGLLAYMAYVAGFAQYEGQGAAVFGIGVVLGSFAAILLGSSCLLFGAVDPRFVPLLILGQTTAGVYTNVVARVMNFEPGCAFEIARAYLLVASGTVVAVTILFLAVHHFSLLDEVYKRHEVLFSTVRSVASMDSLRGGESALSNVSQTCTTSEPRVRKFLGFTPLCWCMAICQMFAIAMNMSLTPLSNQVAHGDYSLSQELVLVKLLSDFVGRSVFLLLPKPRPSKRFGAGTVYGHAIFVWLVELLRFPFWISVFMWSLGSSWPSFLSNPLVLTFPVWMPLISSGAMSASWCFVICLTAAPAECKRSANLLMSFSVYAGFFLGICIALSTG